MSLDTNFDLEPTANKNIWVVDNRNKLLIPHSFYL